MNNPSRNVWITVGAVIVVAFLAWTRYKAPAPAPAAEFSIEDPASPGQGFGELPPVSPQGTPQAPLPAFTASSSQPPGVVLITMEATRADHLGCYNDPTAQTPALDALARGGALFEEAIATAPLTLPSLTSILTGSYPPRHGVRDNTGFTLDAAQVTLAEHLAAQGFKTAASVGSRVLGKDAGLKQGFESYAQPSGGSRGADYVVNDAIEAVNRMKGSPFFLWVQLDDPSAPYTPPSGLRAKFAGRPYDGDIAWMDTQLARFFDHLDKQGLSESTIVIATAAEGEGLGEHGEDTHGLFVYEATVKVPLIVRYTPRIQPGLRSKRLVSLADVAPTLSEMLGLPPLPGAQGRSFAAVLAGQEMPDRAPVYVESIFGARAFGWAPLHAIRTATTKYIDAPDPEIYDIRRDPSETINTAAGNAEAVSTLRSGLDQMMRTVGVPPGEAAPSPGGRDPKPLAAVANLYTKALTAMEDGHPEQAPPLLSQALAKDPQNPGVKMLLAELRGEPTPATTPQSAEEHYARGNVLIAKGDMTGGESELRAAVAADPNMADGWNKLGIVLDKSKRRPEALTAFSRALSVAPDHPDALFNRAKLNLLEDRLPDARRDVDRLLTKHPEYAAGRYLEAHLCMAEKNPAGAKAALAKFLALPDIEPRMKASAEDMLAKIQS